MAQRDAAPLEAAPPPVPALLLRRGPVSMRLLTALHEDPRFELFVTNELTPEWRSLAQRVAGILVATEGDPVHALAYVVTAGIAGPIVMLTTRGHKRDCEDLLAAGATACVVMPATTRELGRVLPLLHNHASSSRIESTLRLFLDPIGRVVRHHDKHVQLSQREFAVLHCLSSHGGRPVSAEYVLTSVWGDASSVDHSRQILDVYIFQLRKKLERIGLKGAISTVRGFGYALVQVGAQNGH
jgi:DNA-binding response OmpR family regulator